MSRVWSQRKSGDADLRAHGCALFSIVALRGIITDRGMFPDTQAEADRACWLIFAKTGVSKADFRQRGLRMSEVAKAVADLQSGDRPKIRSQRLSGVKVRDLARLIADNPGSAAIIAVRYGVLVDAGYAPSGVTFRVGHAMCVVIGASATSFTLHDPLRGQTITIPIDVIEHAMESFGAKPWGDGRGEAVVAYRWRTYEELYPIVKGQRDEARADVARLEAELAACKAGDDDVEALLAEARAKGIADAAAAAGAVR